MSIVTQYGVRITDRVSLVSDPSARAEWIAWCSSAREYTDAAVATKLVEAWRQGRGRNIHEAWKREQDMSKLTGKLRDEFAAAALPAIIAVTAAGQHHVEQRSSDPAETSIPRGIARDAYAMADAMLLARDEAPESLRTKFAP